jgi:hypothetical protein
MCGWRAKTQLFLPGCFSTHQCDGFGWNIEAAGQPFDQRVIGLAALRRCFQAHSQCFVAGRAVHACSMRSWGIGDDDDSYPYLFVFGDPQEGKAVWWEMGVHRGAERSGSVKSRGFRTRPIKKARHLSMSGFKHKYLTAYGLLAVGNGHAACGFRVV